MDDISVREVFDNIGEIIYEIEPELTELIEEDGTNKDIIERLSELEKDAKLLRDCVYKEYYKDEMQQT